MVVSVTLSTQERGCDPAETIRFRERSKKVCPVRNVLRKIELGNIFADESYIVDQRGKAS